MRLRVLGVVQGVGFRPFVHRLAARHCLDGSIRNSAADVQIEVEGAPEAIDAFVRELRGAPPPLARIEQVVIAPVEPAGRSGFAILDSDAAGGRLPVSPDVGMCFRCEAELFDPANRRYRYPFITCTDCGPRFTVIDAMPYDRERTSMREFAQCAECLAEYRSPGSRRFHSQTNSCPACGPRLWLERNIQALENGDAADPLGTAARYLREGSVVAIRGLGGFHLAVDAGNAAAVERLRRLKHREAKPLAIMVRTLAEAERLGELTAATRNLLLAPERPIVLVPRRADAELAPGVAPALRTIGVMLAYTPLHHLLLERADRPLVMTSGNRHDEPIAMTNEQARERLRWIADIFLMHDREILSRYDDSVIRADRGTPIVLRRARGYAPLPLPLPIPAPAPLLSVGAQLKSTFALACDGAAYVSQHIGDLDDLDVLEHFLETLRLYRRLFHLEPRVVVRDLHPDYLSSRIADDLGLARAAPVQHHHAHVAAVLAEHGESGPAVGIAYDGAGYGDDGAIWGSEILVADLREYRRAAHLRYAPLPGGDAAASRPWRSVVGYQALHPGRRGPLGRAFEGVNPRELAIARQQADHRLNAPSASSMGRLFDAAAAVLGVRRIADYEGQAAMELETLAGSRPARPLAMPVTESGGRLVMDPVPLLEALGSGMARGTDPADLAAAFHETLACVTADVASRVCAAEGIGIVALAGGVFQNARLLDAVREKLAGQGLKVLVPTRLSPNDGAISYGQCAVGAARLAAGAAVT